LVVDMVAVVLLFVDIVAVVLLVVDIVAAVIVVVDIVAVVIIVNDPYRTVIPPLTQQEIRATTQQVLSPQYYPRSHTDRTLRW
ncbi:unnamed protein product, partial [Rotaria sp. Silwood1]